METELGKRDILRMSNEESNRITRECLRVAMIRLMDKKEFEKISITEITELAGVSRTSFYRNYDSKEALVQDICEQVFSMLKEAVNSEAYQHDRKTWYTTFFQTVKENQDYFRIYLNAHLDVDGLFGVDALFPANSIEEHYMHAARGGAFYRVLTVWFKNGMQESPEKMGEICDLTIREKYG